MSETTLLGLAAVVSALGGLASTIMALRKSRSEEYQQCIENLKKSRQEAEELAQELHKIRMAEDEG